ncbi:MAG: hypothetical protein ABI120_07765 [Gemmatimonadaceae bacterium]
MKNTIPFLTLLAAVSIAACVGSPANDRVGSANRNDLPVLPTTITLAAGASTEVPSANLSIRFDSVTGESRCPSDVQCIQAGSATVALTISQLSGVMTAQLLSLTTITGKDTATSYGQPIRLVNVAPVPVSTASTPRSAYRIELKVGAQK